MSSARRIRSLPVPVGPRVREVLPALRHALAGDGPALLPVSAGEPTARDVEHALGAGEPLESREDDPGDPTALVIATSGSTGNPKGVLLPASALRASAEATHRHLGGPGRWLLAMPAHHIAGMQVLIRSLLAGVEPEVVETSGGFRPAAFAEAARRTHSGDAPAYTAMVPTQLTRLLDAGDENPEALRALRAFDAVLLGGAATPPALLERARDHGVAVVTTYGMTETSGGCVYDGVPLPGTQVHIDTGEPAGAAGDDRTENSTATGAISLAGPMLARGYRRIPDAAAFSAGWFRTGDLGRTAGGKLEVLGRADDMIITGGVNIAPSTVEQVLARQPGVRQVCVLGVDDDQWGQAVLAAVVADAPDATLEQTLRAAVRERLGPASTPKRIAFRAGLPLRGPGKPDRNALRDELSGGA